MAMSPAMPAAAVTATLTLREDGKEPIDVDVSVLKVQAGDVLVLQYSGFMRDDTAARLSASVEKVFPGLKAIVMGEGLNVAGVIRQVP